MVTGGSRRVEKNCPLPSAHTRLHDVHDLWHRTVAAYPDPDEFVLLLNQCLVTVRQVTFMLQKEKRKIPDFEEWYEGWRVRLDADPLMRWLRDARNYVEKQGDLDISSTAKVSIIATWLDGPYEEFEVPPLMGPEEIASDFRLEGLPDAIRKQGVLEVERRWVSKDLPDQELTSVLAHGYGVLSTMLAEAHAKVGYRMRTFGGESHEGRHVRTDHLGGRLPCMVTTRDLRTAHLHLASGELLSLERSSSSIDLDREGDRFEERMRDLTVGPRALQRHPGDDFLDWGRRWSSIARRMLARDGYHAPAVWLFDKEEKPLTGIGLNFADQAEKHLAMRHLAEEIERLGAYGLILINEVWQARMPKEGLSPTMLRASERPDREEALALTVASQDGRCRTYLTPFGRDPKGRPVLKSEEVIEDDQQLAAFLMPVRKVWRRWDSASTDSRPSEG